MDGSCRILVVDDEYIMRQGIKHMVDWSVHGFEMIGEASNGKEALEKIKENPPNIIISDVMMPQMDGIELSKIIQEKYPQIKIIILSSYSDFEYVKSCFQYGVEDYILKPSLNPNELLETLKRVLEKNFSQTLINDNSAHIANSLTRMVLGFDSDIDMDAVIKELPHNYFAIFGIDTLKACPIYQDRATLIEDIQAKIEILKQENEINAHIVDIQKDILLIILNFDYAKEESVRLGLKRLSRSVMAEYNDAFFVLTEKFEGILNLKKMYEASFQKGLQEQFYNKGNCYVEVDSENKVSEVDGFKFKTFAKNLSSLQIAEALEFLREYVVGVINQKALSEFEIKSLIQNALYNVVTTLEGLNFNLTSLNMLKLNYFEQIDNTKYSQELLEVLGAILEDFSSIISNYQSKFDSHVINKIIAYVHENYDKPLALADVAKIFNMNYFYLSSYFSAHNNEGFNEFLNKIRIEKAVELLKQDIPIADISSMVGYSEHSYFCKVFKKFMGATPSNFRKNFFK